MNIEHNYFDAQSVRIHYVTCGSGQPLVLLHGWPQTWYCWRKVIPQLSEQFSIVAPDLRGLGDSSRPMESQRFLCPASTHFYPELFGV